jgi:hypothetical protein
MRFHEQVCENAGANAGCHDTSVPKRSRSKGVLDLASTSKVDEAGEAGGVGEAGEMGGVGEVSERWNDGRGGMMRLAFDDLHHVP